MNAIVRSTLGRGTWTIGCGFLVPLLATAALMLPWPQVAQAGSYSVVQCHRDYLGTSIGTYDATFWRHNNGFNGPVQCPPGPDTLGVGVSIQNPIPISIGGSASWTFTAPPGTWFRNTSFWWKMNLLSGFSGGIALYPDSGGPVAVWGLNDNTWHHAITLPTFGRRLIASMGCGGVCPQSGGSIVQFSTFSFEMLDAGDPQITGLGGSLVAGGDRAGTETLTINATDPGSGVRRATVSVNGARLPELTNSCLNLLSNGVATRLTPCPSARLTTQVNTELPPWRNGANSVEVCASDYATGGAPNTACTTRTVYVDNSCQASGGDLASAIAAGIEDEDGGLVNTREVKSTRGATVRGMLTAGGRAVPGANVCLYERADAPGEDRQLSQIARTKNDGTFAVQVPAGPSRDLDLVYRYSNHVVRHGKLRLDSEVVPTLRIRPKTIRNGKSAHFKGRIPGPHQADRAVTLQAKAGKKWRTFKQVRTDEKGKFKAKYPFRHTRGKVTYRFRARIKRQGGYPYAPGSSKKRKVKVIG